MSVELGDFPMDASTWLIDTRVDEFGRRRALLLQHPGLGVLGGDDELPVLDDRWNTIADRVKDVAADAAGVVLTTADPISGQSVEIAVHPVTLPGRTGPASQTGWIVAVRSDGASPSDPVVP